VRALNGSIMGQRRTVRRDFAQTLTFCSNCNAISLALAESQAE
jgi:hypothetical protein